MTNLKKAESIIWSDGNKVSRVIESQVGTLIMYGGRWGIVHKSSLNGHVIMSDAFLTSCSYHNVDITTPLPTELTVLTYSGKATGHGRLSAGSPVLEGTTIIPAGTEIAKALTTKGEHPCWVSSVLEVGEGKLVSVLDIGNHGGWFGMRFSGESSSAPNLQLSSEDDQVTLVNFHFDSDDRYMARRVVLNKGWVREAEPEFHEVVEGAPTEVLVEWLVTGDRKHPFSDHLKKLRVALHEFELRRELSDGKRRHYSDQGRYEWKTVQEAAIAYLGKDVRKASQIPSDAKIELETLVPAELWAQRETLDTIEIPGLGRKQLEHPKDYGGLGSSARAEVRLTRDEAKKVTSWPFLDVVLIVDGTAPFTHWSHVIYDGMYTPKQRWFHASTELGLIQYGEYSVGSEVKTISIEGKGMKKDVPTEAISVDQPLTGQNIDIFHAVLKSGDRAEIYGDCGVGRTLVFEEQGVAHVVIRRVSAGSKTRYYIATVSSDGVFGPAPAGMAVSDQGVAYWED